MTTLLTLDPGGTTGWSTWHYSPTSPLTNLAHGQIEGGLKGFLDWWDVDDMRRQITAQRFDEVVSETFVLDGRTPRPDTTPLLVEGALSVLFPSWVGQRNYMKRHADDLTLKRVGFWWPGEQHARDSARHALAYMKLRKHRPSLERFWPAWEEA